MKKNKYLNIVYFAVLIILVFTGCERTPEQQVTEEFAVVSLVEGEGKVVKTPDQPVHARGSVVKLVANAEEGWEFSHWLQEGMIFASALEKTIEIEVLEEKEFTVIFLPEEEIVNLEVEGKGSIEEKIILDANQQTSSDQLLVELEAVPEEEWIFAGWLGDIQDSDRRINNIVIDRMVASNIRAVFVYSDYSLSLGIRGEGEVRIKEVKQGDEILEKHTGLAGFTADFWTDKDLETLLLAGSVIELTGVPKEGWRFTGWSGDMAAGDNPVQMEINSDLGITANFEEVVEYTLELDKQGEGRVEIEVVDYPLGEQEHYVTIPGGAEVQVSAVPDPGWNFVNWMGNVNEEERGNPTLNIIIEEDINLTAVFEQEQFSVEISVEGNGVVEEKIISLPEGFEDLATIYPPDTEIEFTALPDQGWTFSHWEGDVTAGVENNNPLTVVIERDLNLIAVFEGETMEGEAQLSGTFEITHNWPYSRTFSGGDMTAGMYEVDEREVIYTTEERKFVEGEMIIVFDSLTVLSEREKILNENNLQVKAVQTRLNSYLVKTDGISIPSAVSSILSVAGVRYAEPNYLYRIQSVIPDDPGFEYQWHYPQIRLPQAWEITTGSRSIRIGVLDTGIDDNHPDLETNIAAEDGYSFPDNNRDYLDNHGHGTHVAGTIGATTGNQDGVAGVMWEAEIVPIKVLDDDGYGDNWDICQGILYAAGLTDDPVISSPLDVINMSLGGSSSSEYMEEAVMEAYNAGLLMIAAAGNSNTDLPMFPASYPEVISVGSVELNYPEAPVRAPYSCYGETLDVMAPGGNTRVDTDDSGFADGVLSTTFSDDSGTREYNYVYYQGTSMASPHVAGLAGLLLADGVPSDQVRNVLRSTAFDLGAEGFDEEFGYGLINAHWALNRTDSIRILVGLRDGDIINSVREMTAGLQDREFDLENVPAGSYRVYAWIDILGNNRLDPGDYLAESELIDFVDGESYNQTLELTELE